MKTLRAFINVTIVSTICLLTTCKMCGPDTKLEAPTYKRVMLFDGKTLDGWTVLKCEAAVDKGEILIKSGNGLIQTKKQYSDFIIEFDWKALRDNKWDSGVYFRYTSIPKNRPWPNRYQLNLRQGMEGDVSALKNARSKGLIKPGEWNHFKLTVKGTKASLSINGKHAWTSDGISSPDKGFIALQAEVPGGGRHRFRNIFLTELKQTKKNQ